MNNYFVVYLAGFFTPFAILGLIIATGIILGRQMHKE